MLVRFPLLSDKPHLFIEVGFSYALQPCHWYGCPQHFILLA